MQLLATRAACVIAAAALCAAGVALLLHGRRGWALAAFMAEIAAIGISIFLTDRQPPRHR